MKQFRAAWLLSTPSSWGWTVDFSEDGGDWKHCSPGRLYETRAEAEADAERLNEEEANAPPCQGSSEARSYDKS